MYGIITGVFMLLLKREGWQINYKEVYRIYREERLNLRNKSKRKRISTPRAPERDAVCTLNESWSMGLCIRSNI